jgi:lysophospholipase L1-like esterase
MLISRALRRVALAASLSLLAACGGGDSPTDPSSPGPSGPTSDVVGIVFYDENGNGQIDAAEGARLPDVVAEAGGRSGRSERGSGRVVVTGVPQGAQMLQLRASSLPAYYRAGAAVAVSLPQDAGREIPLPVTLAIGSNIANRYLEFGDSITDGDGSSNGDGYRGRLEQRLVPQLNRANVFANGVGGTTTIDGAERIGRALSGFRPAYMLILYGTNDWNQGACNSDISTCFTASNIQSMIRSTKAASSLPIVSTIIPANTGYDARAPADRNVRVAQMNTQIRALCAAEGVPVAESFDAFMRAAGGNLSSLFVDHVHPNDRGHDLIAQSFFEAITRATASALFGDAPQLVGFARPGSRRRGASAAVNAAPVLEP